MRRSHLFAARLRQVCLTGLVIQATVLLGHAEEDVSFSRDIKPILSANCFACHGPDEGHREAGLRLDVRESAVDSAIVPGDAAGSLLVEMISTDDPDLRMPPLKSKRPSLSSEQIDLIRRWIDQGAVFDAHWSYQTPSRPQVPSVKNPSWPLNAIDHFVVHRLDQLGLAPSVGTDRRILIRRLYFDLTGLPPSPEEIDALLGDQSPDAIERVVDRLLASKHFGERMAMYWLDLVRYADTNGIHGDNHRDHDLYRDYVINAFNDNMPFDQFTIEQLAGDLLDAPTKWQRIASGYNRLNMTTREGGAQAKEYRAKYAADRVRNASAVWLGSTMGCAECHNHKFDPFTMRDFYSFAAFFADIQETAVGVQKPIKMPTDRQERRLKELDSRLAALRRELSEPTAELRAEQEKWVTAARAELAARQREWTVVRPVRATSRGGASLKVQDDLSVLASGDKPAKDVYEIQLPPTAGETTGLRIEALTHPGFPGGGLSRANGNFVMTGVELLMKVGDGQSTTAVEIAGARADYAQKGFPIEHAIDGKPDTGWAVEGHVHKQSRNAVLVFKSPMVAEETAGLLLRLHFQSQHNGHSMGRFRLSVSQTANPSLPGTSPYPDDVATALKSPQPTPAQQKRLAEYFRTVAPSRKPLRDQVAALEKERKATIDMQRPVLVAMSGSPRAMRILPRGNWLDDSGAPVQPDVPSFLAPLDTTEDRATRLDLARWLVRKDNPLVARVMVNRLWKLAFGKGLAPSLDDFGAQGVVPSHPELLDWLAVEFIESGWDVKHLLKLMVMSRTYRQSSRESKTLRERDPANRWLARQNRFRLDAEMIRDNALAIGGLLVRRVGGASVRPYQPAGYWAHLNFPRRTYKADRGESQYRRGLYTYWCRTFLHPSLLAFDAPSREESCVERPRSNTPLQSLVLLNDPTYVEAARALAMRILEEGGGSTGSRIEFVIRAALGRRPGQAESELLAKLYFKHAQQYAESETAANDLVNVGQTPLPEHLDKRDLAAWTSVARVVLNLHETITRD